MKRTLSLSVLGIGLLALALAAIATDMAPSEDGRIQRIENGLLPGAVIAGEAATMNLAERMAHYKVPGVSIAVIDEGEIAWAKGYGVLDAHGTRPVTTDTRFQAASISKPVAAMAALALVQQGRLSLDEDVNRTLTSWHVPHNEFTKDQKVTLRRLLSHSAGLIRNDVGSYAAGEAVPDLARFAMELQRAAQGRSTRVLSADTAKLMLTRQLGGHGFGVWLGGDENVTTFSHGGANEGYRCMLFAYVATGQGAVVMTNGDRGDGLFNEVMRAIAAEYDWPDYRPPEKTMARIDPAIYQAYVGQYDESESRITISTDRGHLYIAAVPFGQERIRLYPSTADRFFLLEG